MNIKEARALVESYEKLDPNYKEAVEMCIEDDKPKVKSKVKPKVKIEVNDARS